MREMRRLLCGDPADKRPKDGGKISDLSETGKDWRQMNGRLLTDKVAISPFVRLGRKDARHKPGIRRDEAHSIEIEHELVRFDDACDDGRIGFHRTDFMRL